MNYRSPLKLLTIAVFAFVALFAMQTVRETPADGAHVATATVNHSSAVKATTVDVSTVATAECLAQKAWISESVGKSILNVHSNSFEPVEELAGYRTVIEKPKIATYNGFGNTRARERVHA